MRSLKQSCKRLRGKHSKKSYPRRVWANWIQEFERLILKQRPFNVKFVKSFSQTREIKSTTKAFIQFPCFYCRILIQSGSHLSEHFEDCKRFGEQKLIEIKKESDENNATKIYPTRQRSFNYKQLLWKMIPCDICSETFEFDRMLKLHMMFNHPR